ncbi:hypothetical protein [Conexibacter sp. SYSU D00693]|uniref:hypothetical protein n=1 Tax=Conexibacter sp. SYSU D00693 TaxID=2812560 RepID=UPI00196AE460|nr:hypothetical protein [Conexibacter sp. SYSU D00693]
MAVAAAPSAHAALAGAPTAAFDDRPDLISARVLEDNTNSYDEVRFCFDQDVRNSPIDDEGFYLRGYNNTDSERSDAATLELGDGLQNCVRVRFNNVSDSSNFTVGAVDGPAGGDDVRSVTGSVENLADATALINTTQGTDSGNTTLANIIGTTVDPTTNRIEVTFDRPIQTINDPSDFIYVDDEGNTLAATSASIVNGDRRRVRANFPTNGGADTVRHAVRLFVGDAAVTDQNGNTNQYEVWDDVASNGQTSRPDLVGAEISGPNSVDFEFDANQPVKVGVTPALFQVRDREGVEYAGIDAVVLQLSGNQRVVRVYFPTDTDVDGSVVQAAILPGAVLSNGAAFFGAPNTAATIGIGNLTGNPAGFTDAPDATGYEIDQDSASILVSFDEDIDDVPGGPGAFVARGINGNVIAAASTVVTVDGNTVRLQFTDGGQVAATYGVDIAEDAVEGPQGDLSIQQIVGRTPVNPPAPGPGNPPAPPAANNGGGGGGGVLGTGGSNNPTARVSPARSTKAGKARVLYAKFSKGTVTTKVSGKAKTAKIQVTFLGKKGKLVKKVTKTVKTNKVLKLKGLIKKYSAVKSVRVKVL